MLKRATFCTLVLVFLISSEVRASEFGNIFGPSADDQSRKASAQALDALSTIFLALRDRELKEIVNGQAKLKMAAAALKDAADQMRKIQIGEIDLDRFSNDQEILNLAKVSGVLPPKNLNELYQVFILQTDRMADLVSKFSERDDSSAVMPELAPAIIWYIHAGELITRVSAKLKH